MLQMYLCDVCKGDFDRGEGGTVEKDGKKGRVCPQCLETGRFVKFFGE